MEHLSRSHRFWGSIGSSLSLSPDGNSLAYIYSTYYGVSSPGEHLAVIRISDGKTIKLFDVPGNTWSPGFWTLDGRALQTVRTQGGVSNIWEQPLEGKKPKQLTHFTSGQIFDFTWSADRTYLLVTRGKVSNDVVLLTGLRCKSDRRRPPFNVVEARLCPLEDRMKHAIRK